MKPVFVDEDMPIKVSRNTWHYRNWQAWLKGGGPKRHRYLPRWRTTLWETLPETVQADIDAGRLIVEQRKVDSLGLSFEIYEPPERRARLCIYTRVVLLWGPFVRFAQWHIRLSETHYALTMFLLWIYVVMAVGGFINLLSAVTDSFLRAWWWAFIWVVAGSAAIAILVMLVAGANFVISEFIAPWFRSRRNRNHEDHIHVTPKPKQPNIVVERIKAFDRKICPLLEFEE